MDAINYHAELYYEARKEYHAKRSTSELLHNLTMEFQSLNRIYEKKAANWQVAYRECIAEQHIILTELFNRKTSNNEAQSKNEKISE